MLCEDVMKKDIQCCSPRDSVEKAARSFAACAHRLMFSGHHHRWLVATADSVLAWDGTTPIHLERPGRYLVVVGAVCEGTCGVYDTQTSELIPIHFRGECGAESAP